MINGNGKCVRVKGSFVKIKWYFYSNPGALFIIAFDVLILACAFLVVQGNPLVNDVAVFAYCFLVFGVILQALSYVRNKTCRSDVVESEG
jgi:hypothetical protein